MQPLWVELLHESSQTRVTRLVVPGPEGALQRVIRKEIIGPDAEERLRHERSMLRRLAGVPGIVQLASTQPYPGSLLLSDVAGGSLARVQTPLAPGRLAATARALARAVASLHRRGVVHRDLNPANLLLAGSDPAADSDDPSVYLIDFALATTSSEMRPAFTHHSEIVGAMPYLAPEQTGRVSWPVDQRADLYAVGATLYELATGEPPFGRGDPLRLSHDHLARVPAPPHLVNPAVPVALSEIITHLLEKEPDRRYQTADGLLHDLTNDGLLRAGAPGQIGEHDYPARLRPPARLVGRAAEIAALGSAFTGAMTGQVRAVLVSGPPGVGKTSLIDELRQLVTASNGWLIAGKFDPYRRDQEFEGAWQAFRQLGRLLLAEPEEELARLRPRLLAAVGSDAGLMAALHPEFGTLLEVKPDPAIDDPLATLARLQRMGVEILRVVASPDRPVVLVLDDLQWAGRAPLGLADALVAEPGAAGLLVVGAYREQEVDATHPLSAMLSRWQREDVGLAQLRLGNLAPASVAELLGDVLRLPPDRATALAEVLTPYGAGNPNDTVELLNSLRREGLLVARGEGWHWEPAKVREHLARTVVADLAADRAESMPTQTRSLLRAMAGLGGRVELAVLLTATGLARGQLEHALEPALDDGLLVMEPGRKEAVRFRHDQVQEAILRRLPAGQHRTLRLRLARRLAAQPELFAVAAEQYLPAVDAVVDPTERAQVTEVLRRAADQAALLSNFAQVERYLSAAARLIDPADRTGSIEVHTGRHAALYSLGRLTEADEAYQAVIRLGTDPMERVEATLVQVSSLTNRNRPHEAMSLGLELLGQLGHPTPGQPQLSREIDKGLAEFTDWVNRLDSDELDRPELADPRLRAVGALINRMMPPAYFTDHQVLGWLALVAWRIWTEHGPGPTLVGPMTHVAYEFMLERGDYRMAHEGARRVLVASEARGYEPASSQCRFLYALGGWSRLPLEECLRQAELAREGLIRCGDLQNACFTRHVTVYALLDCAPSLEVFNAEVVAALAFARRTGNDQSVESHLPYQRLIHRLRGEEPGEPVRPEQYRANRSARTHIHLVNALLAALFGETAELFQETAELMRELPSIAGGYSTVPAHLLRGLALAETARTAADPQRAGLLSELDQVIEWLDARAAGAPDNLRHLLRLVEAERSWAAGDTRAALAGFDTAIREVSTRQRPWQRALALERAARFHRSQGLEHTGRALLAQARQAYLEWGATAKVSQLDWAYPHPRGDLAPAAVPSPDGRPAGSVGYRSNITTGSLDLLGIHSASQVLSSETTIEGLRSRVVEALSAMTGATSVRLLLWDEEEQGWLLTAPTSERAPSIPLAEAGRLGLLPVSTVRYVERTGEPLVASDATRDDRFARDPYLANLASCSLMVVPVRSRGDLQAMLLLENRLIRGAFAADRLNGVLLIAGQLAVSLRNALVYSSLERKVAERTEELALANSRLERLSITDALTGLANRRRLETVLRGEWERSQRAGTPLALAMVDIDHFKLYNDHYGHLAGDRCLQRVGSLLPRQLRRSDLVARYGGEEFAVVMPGVDLAAVLHTAERLRLAVAELREPHPLVDGGLVTVSIGAAAMVAPGLGRVSQLTELADAELYHAKRDGRNRVRPLR